jgi:hypothetical protein
MVELEVTKSDAGVLSRLPGVDKHDETQPDSRSGSTTPPR